MLHAQTHVGTRARARSRSCDDIKIYGTHTHNHHMPGDSDQWLISMTLALISPLQLLRFIFLSHSFAVCHPALAFNIPPNETSSAIPPIRCTLRYWKFNVNPVHCKTHAHATFNTVRNVTDQKVARERASERTRERQKIIRTHWINTKLLHYMRIHFYTNYKFVFLFHLFSFIAQIAYYLLSFTRMRTTTTTQTPRKKNWTITVIAIMMKIFFFIFISICYAPISSWK